MLAAAHPQHVDGLATQEMTSSSYLSMQGARSNPLDLNNATPRHIPRLAVRNQSPDETAVIDTSQSSEESHGEIQAQSAEEWPSSDVPTRLPSKPILMADHRHHRHESKDSNTSDGHSRGRQASKRKSASVLGFFTLKEPSISALDQFAEHERRKAAQKGAQSVAAVTPGVSSQKLPNHVPKVNSKWDGLPEGAKRKSVDRRDKEVMKRSSIISIGSVVRGGSPRRPYGSMSSKPFARRSQDKKRTTVHVEEIKDDRPASSRALFSPPPPTSTHPALRQSNQQTFMDLPSYSPYQTYATSPEIELPELPPLQDRDYSSGTVTSPDASPRTPAFDSVPMTKNSNAAAEPPSTFWLSDSDDVVVKTAGPDVLEPPTSHPALRSTRSATKVRPAETIVEEADASPSQTNVRTLSRTATLGTEPLAAMVRNFSHVSKYYQRSSSTHSGLSASPVTTPSVQSPTFSAVPSPSTRPTTMSSNVTAPDRGKSTSPMPIANALSPKDRLSLGPQIKKNEVLPWEMFEPPPETPAPTLPKSTSKGDSSKLKRLSYKLGKK